MLTKEENDTYESIEAEAPPGSFSKYDMGVMIPEFMKLSTKSTYVEIGVQYGRSLYIAAKYSQAGVYGIDIQPTLKRELLQGLIYSYTDEGSEKAELLWELPIDLLFIDGNHSYHGCARDIELWRPHVLQGGTILFHDYDASSPGVIQAVNEFFGGKVQTFKDTVGNTSMAKVVIE